MRKRRVMSFSSKFRDEQEERLDHAKLSELPFEDFQVQLAIIEILTRKGGRQFEDFQFMHSSFMETEFYSSLIRDYGVEFAFEVIQNMEYEQVDSHTNLYQDIQSTQPDLNIYFILHGNISKVRIQSDLQKSQITVQPEIQSYKKGEAVGLEILSAQNSPLSDYTYVTKSRCDLAKINRGYLQKKLETILPKVQRWRSESKSMQSCSILNIIKQNALFDLVGHFDLLDITNQSQMITVNQGEYLYQKKQKCKYFYLILEGDIQIIQGLSQLQSLNCDKNQNVQIQPPTLISHRRAVSFGGYLLNSKSGQGSPANNQPHLIEQVLSTIGKDELLGLTELILSPSYSSKQLEHQYSTKVSSKQAKLLQIKGKVIKKLKIINSSSYNRIIKLVLEQKRIYEERERMSEAVKLNFMKQVTEDDGFEAENLRYNFSFVNADQDKALKMSDQVSSYISNQNTANINTQNQHNVSSSSNTFHQLYSQAPYQLRQPIQKRRGSYNERLNFARLSIENMRNNNNPTAINENRSSSSSSHQVGAITPNIILPPTSTTINSINGGSKQSIGVSTIENSHLSCTNNNALKQMIQNKKQFDIFNSSDDPICQTLSMQMTEQMAKNKKRYFIQAMRELEKSSRTNPYAHQQQNSLYQQQNKSNDMLRRSPNVRERSILEKYIKIKKKTEFKTDIDRKEERLRLQQLQQQQQQQQQILLQQQQHCSANNNPNLLLSSINNDISIKLSTNNTNNETINSKKQLRIISDNPISHNRLNKSSNQTKMDYYYDHPIQQTPFYENQINISGKQTPNQFQEVTCFQVQNEVDQILSGNTLSNPKLVSAGAQENENVNALISKKYYQKEENTCAVTPLNLLGSSNATRMTEAKSSMSSQQYNSSNLKRNNDQPQICPLQEIKRFYNNNQMNSNDSASNINQNNLLSQRLDLNPKKKFGEVLQQLPMNPQQKILQNQKLFPLNEQLPSNFVQDQENLIDFPQENQLNKFKISSNKSQINKRNQSALRSISVKQRQPQSNNKRVLLII